MDGSGWGPSVPERWEDVSLRTAEGLTTSADSDGERLLRYRQCVQRGRIRLVDACLSFAIGETRAGWKMGF